MFKLLFTAFLGLLVRQTRSTQFTLDPCCDPSQCGDGRSCTFVEFDPVFQAGPCVPGKKECLCSQGEQGFEPCIVDAECLVGDVCYAPIGACTSQCSLSRDGIIQLTEEQQALCDLQPNVPQPCPLEDPVTLGPSIPIPPQDPRTQPEPKEELPIPSEEFDFPTSSFEAGEPTPSVELEIVEEEPTPDVKPEIARSTATPEAEVVIATPTAEVEATPEPTEAVCVAAEELEGVEKVFENHFHAWVLCDTNGSCATPGHMVIWNGAGMMMKSFCDIVGCERKVMAVNSPRWSAGAIRAKTNGLLYTSFAARWESRAEERVLAAVVRLAV